MTRIQDNSNFFFQLFLNCERSFKFDQIFGPDSNQEVLFESTVKSGLTKLLLPETEVSSAAVLAYGQTGTGKTYTMGTDIRLEDDVKHILLNLFQNSQHFFCFQFSSSDRGLIPRVISEIFGKIGQETSVRISFFEILNEKVFDLLKPSNIKVPLRIKEEGNGFSIPELSNKVVGIEQEALALLERVSP